MGHGSRLAAALGASVVVVGCVLPSFEGFEGNGADAGPDVSADVTADVALLPDGSGDAADSAIVDAGPDVPVGPCAGGTTCLAVPAGWQAVTTASGLCPADFGNPQTFVSGVTAAPAVCSCNCSGTQGCSASFTLNQYNAGCTILKGTRALTVTPSCLGNGNGSIIQADSYNVSNVVNGVTPACGASAVVTSKPAPSQTQTVLCQPTAACPGGACVAPNAAPTTCILKAGVQTCPPGFPKGSAVALSVTDTRACGACACGSTLTCALTSSLITNSSACGATAYQLTVSGSTCVPATAPTDYPFNATRGTFSTTGTGACAQTAPSNPTGTVTLATATTQTVCCP